MTASIFPFPLAHRHGMIRRQAQYAATLHPEAAQRHISYQLEIQAIVMRRRGVDETLIGYELACMKVAIEATIKQATRGGSR